MADTTGMTRNAGGMGAGGTEGRDRGQQSTGSVVEKAKDMASNVADRAKDLASNVADKAQGAASTVAHKVEDMACTVGDKASAAASTVADTWQAGSEYVREGAGDMFAELTTLIRRHPVPALLVGFGIGFMLARVIRD